LITIGILSDTHGFLHPKIKSFFKETDEIWHAGDAGSMGVVQELEEISLVRGVYGNIDGREIRAEFPHEQIFKIEDTKVFMIHIGGYPGKYNQYSGNIIKREKPGLFICGHSHILKVIYDNENDLLHINPGAAGKFGSHQVMTAIRLKIIGTELKDLEILEIERG